MALETRMRQGDRVGAQGLGEAFADGGVVDQVGEEGIERLARRQAVPGKLQNLLLRQAQCP